MILLTPVLDTSAYALGDVLFVLTALENTEGGSDRYLQSLTMLDEDDQGQPLTLIFGTSAAAVLGTINAAPSISDADARTLCGSLTINAGDWLDLGSARLATKSGIGMILPPGKLYVGAITGGTPTHTASGLRLNLGLLPL